MDRFNSDDYGEGYWERGEGSNYHNYGDDPGWGPIAKLMTNLVGERLTIVEAACAKGWFVRRARQWGHEAFGFDLSEYALSKAPPGVGKYLEAHDAIDPWPYEPESADIVCAWEFFEHIHDENIPFVLQNMLDTLKPGGQLWLKTGIIVPDDHDFAGQEDHDHTHVAVHDREWWESLFASKGLVRLADTEAALDAAFDDRDWKGRFFVWRRPEHAHA